MSEKAHLHSMPGGAGTTTAESDETALVNMDDLQTNLKELDRQARTFIKKNPLVAIAGAVALGFVVGRVVMK